MNEPRIQIGGRALSVGQVMAVRVAVSTFLADLDSRPYPLGRDEHGSAMAEGFRARLAEVLSMMFSEIDP